MNKAIVERASAWLGDGYDEETKEEVRRMMAGDPKELEEAFYKNLEFGTGGLRGIMGVGSNRMNKYTVGMATQGLVNYLKKEFEGRELKVVVSYDNRNNNTLFANTAAGVFAANGFKVYLFDAMRPTPELSFAIRTLGCVSGVMITASHNPKEYNGYKAYWSDGGQLVSPHDENVIKEVDKISSVDQVLWSGGEKNIEPVGEALDEKYLEYVKSLSLSPEAVEEWSNLKIVYSPMHGAGLTIMPRALKDFGFKNVVMVPAQSVVDGNFPTVKHPNPEDPETMAMAVALAEKERADMVLASDPDADRLAVGIRDHRGELILINGNQMACILTYYILRRWSDTGRLTGSEYIVKTVVTSPLMSAIADSFNVEWYNVLTGFKWIADVIRRDEGRKQYICGGEESFGFMIGDRVRDKDSISAGAIMAEAMAWSRSNGGTLFDMLIDIYLRYGLYREDLVNISKLGITGAEEIKAMMEKYRENPHVALSGSKIIYIYDYLKLTKTDTRIGKIEKIDLPVSDVLQYETEDGTLVSMRPSGTEPKIKFYFSVREKLRSRADYAEAVERAQKKIDGIKKEIGV